MDVFTILNTHVEVYQILPFKYLCVFLYANYASLKPFLKK